jgi:two-component system LytT family sensor kinase
MFSTFALSVLCVAVPLKIWNSFRTERKLEAQQRLATEARLRALTYQINPHFLFNTLNSVSALIRSNPPEARLVVSKLSNILRRLLRKTAHLTSLREELAFIDDYLAIEMVRFREKLRFEKEIAPETLDFQVPWMLLQPLVENSIKHGLGPKLEGGTIRIRSRMADQRLQLTIEDDGVGIPESSLQDLLGQGIGVSNVNERLKVIFGESYRMDVDSKPGEGTRFEIEIPEYQPALAKVG